MNMGPEFNDYLMGIGEELAKLGAKPKMVSFLLRKNYFRIKTAFYEDDSPENVLKILQKQIFESVDYINEAKVKRDLTGFGPDDFDDGSNRDKGGRGTVKRFPIESSINSVTRTVVRDLLNVIKKGQGEYYLPEELVGDEMLYLFPNLPEFSIVLNVTEDMSIKGDYMIDGNTAEDGDEIDIRLVMNPTKFPEAYYDLVADLNDIVRHELEHVLQDFGYRDVQSTDDVKPEGKEYYKQAHEVPAEIAGFRRIVKLRNETPEKVIRDWFNRNQEVHQLPEEDIEELVLYLTDEYQKKYGVK